MEGLLNRSNYNETVSQTLTKTYLTSVMFVSKQEQIPATMFQHPLENLPRNLQSGKGRTTSILKQMILNLKE